MPDVAGVYSYRQQFQGVVELWNSSSSTVHDSCAAAADPSTLWQCFLTQYFVTGIRAPLFVTNSVYDAWQLGNVLNVQCSGWSVHSAGDCNATMIDAVQVFGEQLRKLIAPALALKRNGYFLDTCVVHTETCSPSWYGFAVASDANATMASSFSNWYFGRPGSSQVDDEAPLAWSGAGGNPTCGASVGVWC